MEAKKVEIFGEQETVGDWIVVNPEMTKVIAVGHTAEEALRKAGIKQGQEGKRPVLMQVPDPSMTCLY